MGPGVIHTSFARPRKEGRMRKRKDYRVIQCVVYNALRVGRENALSREELSRITGYRDRLVREAIEALRHDKVIISLGIQGGYYIPDSTPQGRREVAAWLARQDRRMQSIRAATRGARRFVVGCSRKNKDVPGQLSMFGVES